MDSERECLIYLGREKMGTEKKAMRTVTILLTRYSDWFGKFIRAIGRSGYSHASISIDGKEEIFYSFNYKGFVIEKPRKYIPKMRMSGSVCIRMEVPEDTYARIEEEIMQFVAKRERYAYSRWGVMLCLLHIPHKFKDRYFCSQFVAEILQRAGAVKLKKSGSLYLPEQLIDGVECLFSAKQLVYNII